MTRQNARNTQVVEVVMQTCRIHGIAEHYVRQRENKRPVYTCVLCKAESNAAYTGTLLVLPARPLLSWRVPGDVSGNLKRLEDGARRRQAVA